jgi:hypothetical protein
MTRTMVLINLRGARGNGGTGTFAFGSDKSYLPLKFNPSLDQNFLLWPHFGFDMLFVVSVLLFALREAFKL